MTGSSAQSTETHPMGIRLLSVTASAILLVALNASAPVKGYSGADEGLPAQASLEARLQTVNDFDVDAGPLPQQLNLILTSRQVVYLYSFEELQGIEGAAVHGRLSLAEALRIMLQGTGCVHQLFADSIAVSCSEHARVRQVRR
jgi:hypothetical protein